MSDIGYIINNLNTCLLSKLEHEPPSAWQCLSVSSYRLNYKSLKNRCHSCIYFDLSLCLWLTVCLVILVGRKKSHSHHFWVVLYQLIVPGPFSCSAVDQSLLIFLFLPLLPGSHSQQTQAHSGCSSLCEEELVTGSCLLRGPDWDWLRFWAPTVQLVFPSVGGREVCRTFKWCN